MKKATLTFEVEWDDQDPDTNVTPEKLASAFTKLLKESFAGSTELFGESYGIEGDWGFGEVTVQQRPYFYGIRSGNAYPYEIVYGNRSLDLFTEVEAAIAALPDDEVVDGDFQALLSKFCERTGFLCVHESEDCDAADAFEDAIKERKLEDEG